ncbi:hypothetical protein [Micromonospora maritima]|uniref:hypothetical protein n=1 Tax=Micromonospora maritima TaxID=986711 RepID=UPI00157E03CF|nr:hypothetical protein [Micromonospora maritima]
MAELFAQYVTATCTKINGDGTVTRPTPAGFVLWAWDRGEIIDPAAALELFGV